MARPVRSFRDSSANDESGSGNSRSCLNPLDRPGGNNAPSQTERRRSSTSEITCEFDLGEDHALLEGKPSLFCPLPKKGFFYSRAWKEHKKRRKEAKLQAALPDGGGYEGSRSVDDEIPLVRNLTRRKRNSFHKNEAKDDGAVKTPYPGFLEPTNVTAYLAARVESEKPRVEVAYNHPTALLAASLKSHMLDLKIVGRNGGLPVGASKFILGCYSPILEEVFFRGRECPSYDPSSSRLTVDFAGEDVVRAAVHHCFSGELPADFPVTSPSESVARNLAQLDHLAYVYKLAALGEVTYRALRKLINGRSVLACAIFDEQSYQEGAGVVDSIKRYALDTMREMPMDTLLGGGVQWMKEESVEAIMQDQDMDVDEFYMFKILKAWASAKDTGQDRVQVARRLSRHIELRFIDPELLLTEVKDSGYLTLKELTEAVRLVEDSWTNRDPCEMERVLVEGAGTEIVNGIYFRVNDETGMGEEEILFVKEADDGYSDVGLYLWGTRWNIAMCADYSNCFYTCEDPPDKSPSQLVPEINWEVTAADEPPPRCIYLPNQRLGRMSGAVHKIKLAPNLEEMMDPTIVEKRRSLYFDRRTDDVIEKRTMTLEQMMNLPEDLGEDHGRQGYLAV